MATERWVANAQDIAQVDTVTVAGTWAAADTATVTINSKSLTLTVGTDTTTTQVATAIKEMINGDTQTGTGDHTFGETGNNVPEFNEVTATSSAAVVSVTGDSKGKPFTLTATESTAGDGTATRAASVASTGKSHVDLANNWSSGTVPVDADVLVWDTGDTGALYSLADLTDVTPTDIKVLAGYIGTIGLPKINVDDPSSTYPEYRGEYLDIGAAADAQTITVAIGQGDGSGSSRLNFNFGDCQYACTVHRTGPRVDTAVPPLLLKGTHASSTLTVMRGDVGVGFYAGETSHLASIDVAYITNQESDANVWCGPDVDLTDATINQYGGSLTIDSTTSGGDIDVLGGTCTLLSGAHLAVEATGGTVYYQSSGTLTTAIVGDGGVLDFRRDATARTVTNCTIRKGGAIYDTFQSVTWTNGIILDGCSLDDVTLDVGPGVTISIS